MISPTWMATLIWTWTAIVPRYRSSGRIYSNWWVQTAQVLDALQELTRLAVFRETGERSRLMLDISGFRADLRAELVVQAGVAIAQVKESGEATSLEPMTPFERKVVHDAVAAAGLVSESSGTEPRRYVVVLPS